MHGILQIHAVEPGLLNLTNRKDQPLITRNMNSILMLKTQMVLSSKTLSVE